jgi:hypothetical protein
MGEEFLLEMFSGRPSDMLRIDRVRALVAFLPPVSSRRALMLGRDEGLLRCPCGRLIPAREMPQ